MTRPTRVAWIAIVCLPVLALGARWILDAREESRFARPERTRGVLGSTAGVWTADGEFATGMRILVRIAPLHADPERQQFESAALRARHPTLVGDPYLVVLEVRGEAGGRLDPTGLTVVDAMGTALFPPRFVDTGRGDPVAALLGTPGEVGAGERASFVLFGRAPGVGAQLVRDGSASIPLTRSSSSENETDLPVARVDRRARAEPEGPR